MMNRPQNITDCQVDGTELHVIGSIPHWLEGDLYRSGSGTFRGAAHVFDGFAMVVRFNFRAGRVTWNQRYVESEAYLGWKTHGKYMYSELGTKVTMWRQFLNMCRFMMGGGIGTGQNIGSVPVQQHSIRSIYFST